MASSDSACGLCPCTYAPLSSNAVAYSRHCPECGATALEFPGERAQRTQQVWWSGADTEAISNGDLSPILQRLAQLRPLSWNTPGRTWALWLESLHPDLDRWEAGLASQGSPTPFLDGVRLLARERARARHRQETEPQFAAETGIHIDLDWVRAAWCTQVGDVRYIAVQRPHGEHSDALFRWIPGSQPTAVIADLSTLRRLSPTLVFCAAQGERQILHLKDDGSTTVALRLPTHPDASPFATALPAGRVMVDEGIAVRRGRDRNPPEPSPCHVFDADGTLLTQWTSAGGTRKSTPEGVFSTLEVDDAHGTVLLTLRGADRLEVQARSAPSASPAAIHQLHWRAGCLVSTNFAEPELEWIWTRDGDRLQAIAQPRQREPGDTGHSRRTTVDGRCWTEDGCVSFWSGREPAPDWSEEALCVSGPTTHLFAMVSRSPDHPYRVCGVNGHTGERTPWLTCTHPPSQLTAAPAQDAVVVVADDHASVLRFDGSTPQWRALPESCAIHAPVVGAHAVLHAVDQPRRLHVFHLRDGHSGTLASAELVQGPGGPVFLLSNRWVADPVGRPD